MITPLEGVIGGEETLVIEISFTPRAKATSLAEVVLSIKQFDFQPLPISVIGNGVVSQKRVKSSKLAPLKQHEETTNKNNSSRIHRKPSRESQNIEAAALGETGTIRPPSARKAASAMRKSNIRTSYPKLFQSKKGLGSEEQPKPMNAAQIT